MLCFSENFIVNDQTSYNLYNKDFLFLKLLGAKLRTSEQTQKKCFSQNLSLGFYNATLADSLATPLPSSFQSFFQAPLLFPSGSQSWMNISIIWRPVEDPDALLRILHLIPVHILGKRGSTSQISITGWVSYIGLNSDTIYLETASDLQVKGPVLQDCFLPIPTPTHFKCQFQVQAVTCFWPTGYEVLTTLSLGLTNLPDWLTKLRENCTYYNTRLL